jgi:hypothetical protein
METKLKVFSFEPSNTENKTDQTTDIHDAIQLTALTPRNGDFLERLTAAQ